MVRSGSWVGERGDCREGFEMLRDRKRDRERERDFDKEKKKPTLWACFGGS